MMAMALTAATQRAGKVSAATATGRSSETSGLVAPPLKKTMADRAPISNSTLR